MQTHDDNRPVGWADRESNRQAIRYVLYAVCAILVIADFIVHRHVEIPVEKWPAFYAVYGFVALVTVVLLAKGLRRLVGRREDYYEKDRDDHAA